MDYDVVYECARCGKESTLYLCHRCVMEDTAALRAEVEALNVVLEQAREHEAWHNNEQRDMKAEVGRLREAIVKSIRQIACDPQSEVQSGKETELLESWIDGFIRRDENALRRAEKAEAALAEIAEGRK